MIPFQRPDYREVDELRNIVIEPGIAPYAHGSVLIKFGNTQVICSAMIEEKVPKWMVHQGVEGGWITAEYSMLPYSTLDRKTRDSSRGKVDGRSIEIQRLIGRAMRAVVDLKKLPGRTLWIDCDVLQADGGTRTAAVTGAYVAARLAVNALLEKKKLKHDPFVDSVAAVSVGIFQDEAVLDLNYIEDKDAQVDFNVVMTGKGQFVELQGMGEESTFSQDQLSALLELAKSGITKLSVFQEEILNK